MPRGAVWPAGLAALLGVIALAEILAPADGAPAVPAARAAAAAAPADMTGFAAAWSDTILARPIFRPDRRPMDVAAAAPAAMPRLSAIVITAAGAAAIFVADGGTVLTVREGGKVAGQLVKSIAAGTVMLSGPDGISTLRPQYSAAPGS